MNNPSPSHIQSNVRTPFTPQRSEPQIDPAGYVHPAAVVIGAVTIGRRVFVAPMASVRADEGVPFYIGDESNVQDGVVIHGLETIENGQLVEKNLRDADGKKYSVYIGRRVSLAHQCQVHGPAVIGDDTFIGMQAFVFRAILGSNCVVEPAAKIMNVEIPRGRSVPAGMIVTEQSQADALPKITEEYPLRSMNKNVVRVNIQLAQSYLAESGTR